MSESLDEIVEHSDEPSKVAIIWAITASALVGAVLAAASIAFPSIISFPTLFPLFLALISIWMAAALARLAFVGVLPDQIDELAPPAIMQKLWIFVAWKLGGLAVAVMAVAGLVVAWVSGISLTPFGIGLVTSCLMLVVANLALSATLNIAILHKHWASRYRSYPPPLSPAPAFL